jgi:hypothetical protein
MNREIRYYNEAQRVKLEEEAIKGLLFDYYKENTEEMLYCKIQCDYDKNANLNSIFQVYTEKIYLIDLRKDKVNVNINTTVSSKNILNLIKKIMRKEN